MVIIIIDASKKLNEEEKKMIEFIENKKGIILLNKADLETKIEEKEIEKISKNKPILRISALNKDGIEKIYNEISNMYKFNEIEIDDSLTITNNRHKNAINNMITNIEKSEKSIKEKMPIDIITINITEILTNIGAITGESVSEDIINEIFKKFCLGK